MARWPFFFLIPLGWPPLLPASTPISPPSSTPAWVTLPGQANPYCFASANALCVNSSHFLHRGAVGDKLGCAAAFAYNTRHVFVGPDHSPPVVWEQPQPSPPRAGADLGHLPSLGPVAFLFDTGVDRAVHGHFMAKLLQLWGLAHSGRCNRGCSTLTLVRVCICCLPHPALCRPRSHLLACPESRAAPSSILAFPRRGERAHRSEPSLQPR